MKIALCSKGNFSLEKGFTKNRIELAESLKKFGWETEFIDKYKLGIPSTERYNAKRHSLALKEFLIARDGDFDVVLYEYDTLPYNRRIFNKDTLFVARPAILAYNFPLIKFRYDLKTRMRILIKEIIGDLSLSRKKELTYLDRIEFCLSQTDLIQVQNKRDRDLLIQKGFSANKILVVPNGISLDRIKKFTGSPKKISEPYTIAFVGTFDYRKGAVDFPYIFKLLKKRFPDIRLKLLGTKGMFSTVDQVLDFFPKKFHSDIEVIPGFIAFDLPELLEGCSIGIFPSYLESFGFGALEMMCAGLPVVAYEVPGPSDFVLPELLVPVGERNALAKKAITILEDKKLLKELSEEVRETTVMNYCWDDIAKNVDQNYRSKLSLLRKEQKVELKLAEKLVV